MKKPEKKGKSKPSKGDDLPGYPTHPESEDIYNNEDKVGDIEDDDNVQTAKEKKPRKSNKLNEKDYTNDKIGDDLDVPGAELDDDQEDIGEEDEENNYYSLGGDDHDDLDETNADLELEFPEDAEND